MKKIKFIILRNTVFKLGFAKPCSPSLYLGAYTAKDFPELLLNPSAYLENGGPVDPSAFTTYSIMGHVIVDNDIYLVIGIAQYGVGANNINISNGIYVRVCNLSKDVCLTLTADVSL